jgi:hypothetical protein
MAGCGYVCPVCEGKGYDESGNSCEYCSLEATTTISTQDWVKQIHETNSCSN